MSAQTKPMTHLSPLQALAAARAVAVEKMPYFRTGILELVPREKVGLGTFAVTKGSVLMYDPEVLKIWTPMQAGAVVCHEYMHIFLNHEERFRKLVAAGVLQPTEEDHALWNRDADREINDDLIAAGFDLPSFTDLNGHVHAPLTPEAEGYPPNRLAEEYVKLSLKKRPPPDPNGNGNRDPGGVGSGCCGSGAGGNPSDDEPEDSDPDNRSDVDQEVSRKQTMDNIKEASNNRGNVPIGLRRFVEEATKPSRIPWTQKLGRTVRNAVSFKKGAVDFTMKRPSRRQGAFHGMKNAPILPGLHAPTAEVAIVADTSGSMGPDQMRAVCEEANGVMQAVSGANVTFVACDAEVQAVVRTRKIADVKLNMKGGGGTDFRPAFKALESIKPKPQIVVFATDGYGPAPRRQPKGMHVIWLIIPGGRNECPWGEEVYMDYNDEERAAATKQHYPQEDDDEEDDAP